MGCWAPWGQPSVSQGSFSEGSILVGDMAVCAGAEQVGGLFAPLPRKEQLLGVQVIVLQPSHNTRNDASTSAPSAPLLGAGSKSLVLRACVNHGTPFNARIPRTVVWHVQAPQLGQGVYMLRSPLDCVLVSDATYLHAYLHALKIQGSQQCKSEALIVSMAAGFSRNFLNCETGRLSTHLELVEPWLARWPGTRRVGKTNSQHGTPIAFNGASASEELHLPVAVLPSCSISTTAELER